MLSLLPREVTTVDVVPYAAPHARPVGPELGHTFAEACLRHNRESTIALRDATAALVARLKADGLPPERVVIAIKAALVRYGGYQHEPSYNDERETPQDELRAKLYRCVFRWSLDAYYGTSDAVRCCLSA